MAYQRCLTSGTVTSAQGGYAQNNCFAGLTTNEESNKDTANTITGTITSHMAKLSEMTMASINEHATQTNAFLQQLAANTNQLHQQQQDIINQMAMMTINHGAPAPATHQTFPHAPQPIYQPPALPHYQLGYNIPEQQFGGWGTTGRRGGGSGHGVGYGYDSRRARVEEDMATQAYQCLTLEPIN